ncbi:MAG: hypothetical protein MUF06_17000 [Pirellulaceae bacterium]|nr:hypothetical protein [Pirellulaceae bacterium]
MNEFQLVRPSPAHFRPRTASAAYARFVPLPAVAGTSQSDASPGEHEQEHDQENEDEGEYDYEYDGVRKTYFRLLTSSVAKR